MASSGRGHRDGVEITSIGVLYQGPLEKKYWSSSRGKEKYPYPVGYQATRWHGGHCYFMEVSEGPRGPLFVVKCEEGISCSGQTPSVAWEDILKKKHAGAKRVLIRSSCASIDGAEMFGFTNPLVQRLCRDLVVSAIGAAENSNSLPDEELKVHNEDVAEGARRKAGSMAESSQKSPVKARRGKNLSSPPNIKTVGEGAEDIEKNTHTPTLQLVEEGQENKETKKQRMKRPARDSLERPQAVKVVARTQVVSLRKENSTALHSHSEDEEVPVHCTRSKRSKIPRPKEGPLADEDIEHVGSSQNLRSANSRRIKSPTFGTKRMKGEDRQEGQISNDSGYANAPHGLPDGDRQIDKMISLVEDTQQSSAADHDKDVPVSHLSIPSQITSPSGPANVDEASPKVASSKKKRMKLAKPQKPLDSVKPEKYDTEVDLTQSGGFLSIDLMCPSAEDVKKQTPEGPPAQNYEDVSSKQDGYLMLLAACKVAEVDEKNGTKEKTGPSDIKRKRPISDTDSTLNAKSEVPCVPTSSKAPRLSVSDDDGVVNELGISSSDMLLKDQPSRSLTLSGERPDTDATTGKVESFDINVSPKISPRGADSLTVPQAKEDVISHDKLEKIHTGGVVGVGCISESGTSNSDIVVKGQSSRSLTHSGERRDAVSTRGRVESLDVSVPPKMSPQVDDPLTARQSKEDVTNHDKLERYLTGDGVGVGGINELTTSSSDMLLKDQSSTLRGGGRDTDSVPGKVEYIDINVTPILSPRAEDPLTSPQPKEVSSHDKQEKIHAGDCVGVEGITKVGISSSDMLLKNQSSQSLTLSCERCDIDSTPGKVESFDINVTPIFSPRADDPLTIPQPKEHVIIHDKHEKINTVEGIGERLLPERIPQNVQMEEGLEKPLDDKEAKRVLPERISRSVQTEISLEKPLDDKEAESGCSHISERSNEPDQSHESDDRTTGKLPASLKSQEVPVESLCLHEQVSTNMEAAKPGVQQFDARQEDEVLKVSIEDILVMEDNSRPEERRNGKSVKSCGALGESSATCTVVSTDVLPLMTKISSTSALKNFEPGQGGPDGELSPAHEGTTNPQSLESEVEVVENLNSEQSELSAAETTVLETTCDLQIVDPPAGATGNEVTACDEEIPSKILQESESLTGLAVEAQGSLVSHITNIGSQSGPEENLVENASGNATGIKMDCFEGAIDEPHISVPVNGAETGTVGISPQKLLTKVQPALTVIAAREEKPHVEVSSEGFKQHNVVTLPDNSHQLDVDMATDSVSDTKCEESPLNIRTSLNQPFESVPPSSTSAPDVCFGAEATRLEVESKGAGNVNGMVSGVSLDHQEDLPTDFVPEVYSLRKSESGSAHPDHLERQRQTPEAAMDSSAFPTDQVELCVAVERSTQGTTGEAVEDMESGIEPNLGNSSGTGVDTVLNPVQQVCSTTDAALSHSDCELPGYHVDGSEEAADHPEKQSKLLLNGNLEGEMVSSALPVEMVESGTNGSSDRSKQRTTEELVEASVEAVKDSNSGAECEMGHARENCFATVLTSREQVDKTLDTFSQADSKGCTETGDHPERHINIMKTPLNGSSETDVVSSNPFVDKTDSHLADKGIPGVLEKPSPASVEEKDTEPGVEAAHGKSTETHVVTICSPNQEMSSSSDILPQKDQRMQALDLKHAETPVLAIAGCASTNCRGEDQEQNPGAVNSGELVMQGVVTNLTLSTEKCVVQESSFSQPLDCLNPTVVQQQETEHPASISSGGYSTTHATSSVSMSSFDVGVLAEKHPEVDACTTSNKEDAVMMEAECPLASQVQSSASSQNPSQKGETDSAGRELTTSMMNLLLPEAVPFLSSRTRGEKKQVAVVGYDVHSKAEDMEVEASAALVDSICPPSELPMQADLSPKSLEAGQLSNGKVLACNLPEAGVIIQHLEEVIDPVSNQEGTGTVGDSLAKALSGGCPVAVGSEVIAGVQVTSLNGNFEEHRVSSEECQEPANDMNLHWNLSNGDDNNLEGGEPSDLHPEIDSLHPSMGKGSKSEDCNQEFVRPDGLPESADDDCEISQPVPLSGVLCQDIPRALILTTVRDDVADEDLDSCVTSQIAPLNAIDTQDSVKVIGLQSNTNWDLRTSTYISNVEGAAQVQQEAQVCTKAVDLDLDGRRKFTKADMKTEVACKQLAGCINADITALETLDHQDFERVDSSPSELRVKMSTNMSINDEVSLVDHRKGKVFARIIREVQEVGEDQVVHFEESEKRENPMFFNQAHCPNIPSGKAENTSRDFQAAASSLPPSDASGRYIDQSEVTSTLPASVSNLPEQFSHTERESVISLQTSLTSKHADESVMKQPSHFQKMELPISIEHPTKVSTMVINVRGDEIRLCVCCGTGSERTLFVFKVQYREGAHLEHQLLTVVETTFKNHYYEIGEMKWSNEESGVSFTPDGQQLILLDCFKLRESSTADIHGGHGINIVSLEKDGQTSTWLESEGAPLCLAVREPHHLIAAGEDGHINFWDMDPSWRNFEERVSLPRATIDGVPFTSVTSLLVVPHLRHMVVGCNPSGFFALWDINKQTLLYSCQMFDDLLLRTSLVDMKTMNWEQSELLGRPASNGIPPETANGETQECLSALPLICLLTMVTSKERFLSENKKEALNSEDIVNVEQGLISLREDSRVIDAGLLSSYDATKDTKEETPQHQASAIRTVDMEPVKEETREEVMMLTSKDLKSEKGESRKIPGPWVCKTVLMRGGRMVCGHALSDQPTSLTSMGCYGVMGTADGLVHLWDVQKGSKVVQLDDLKGSAVVSLATSSSLAVLATAGENKRVNLYLQKDHFDEVIKKTS